mmetsp:Transcript_21837/g.62218  ORF Transcript_21837/g.62218 Transcript_21837/m.62218 type:complete len:326 (+) Transcript_21837:91-1068(+)
MLQSSEVIVTTAAGQQATQQHAKERKEVAVVPAAVKVIAIASPSSATVIESSKASRFVSSPAAATVSAIGHACVRKHVVCRCIVAIVGCIFAVVGHCVAILGRICVRSILRGCISCTCVSVSLHSFVRHHGVPVPVISVGIGSIVITCNITVIARIGAVPRSIIACTIITVAIAIASNIVSDVTSVHIVCGIFCQHAFVFRHIFVGHLLEVVRHVVKSCRQPGSGQDVQERQVAEEVHLRGHDHATQLRTSFADLGCPERIRKIQHRTGMTAIQKTRDSHAGRHRSDEMIEERKISDLSGPLMVQWNQSLVEILLLRFEHVVFRH